MTREDSIHIQRLHVLRAAERLGRVLHVGCWAVLRYAARRARRFEIGRSVYY